MLMHTLQRLFLLKQNRAKKNQLKAEMIISTSFGYAFTEEFVQLMATYVLCPPAVKKNHIISCTAPLQPPFLPHFCLP